MTLLIHIFTLCWSQFDLKQVCEQNLCIGDTFSFTQVGQAIEAFLPHPGDRHELRSKVSLVVVVEEEEEGEGEVSVVSAILFPNKFYYII